MLITDICSCPQLLPRPGPDYEIVTGTLRHRRGDVLEITLQDHPDRIGFTANHPIWSEDRSDFVPAGDLVVGETLRLADGSHDYLATVTRHTDWREVFNLEVNAQHVYHVSSAGLLVHNTGGKRCFVGYSKEYAKGHDRIFSSSSQSVQNSVPRRLARVVPAEFADTPTLGPPGVSDVFVTGAGTRDIGRTTTPRGIARRLTLIDENGKLIDGPKAVIEFDLPGGIASPIDRSNPGFVGRGRTAGNAREFVIPNYKISDLKNVKVRVVE